MAKIKNKKVYESILASLPNDIEKTEHQRIFPELDKDWSDKYYSTYLLYLSTFSKIQKLQQFDISTATDIKAVYMHETLVNSAQKQHLQYCKVLKLLPKDAEKAKTNESLGGRPLKGAEASASLRDILK